MSRRIKVLAGVSILVVLLAALLAGTVYAQGPNPWAPGSGFRRGGHGPGGMMDGWGPGGMMGPGMMGGWGWGYLGTGTPLTIDQATEAVQEYLAAYGNPDPSAGSGQALALTEVMEFSRNFYAEVEEESTGIHAFELLINRYTGQVYPEPGPNMMWNTKYGHMGRGWGTPTAEMPVTAAQARRYAREYLDVYLSGTTVADEADAFYLQCTITRLTPLVPNLL